jgi:predicted transcriptional regulator
MSDFAGLWIPTPILANPELNITEKMLLAAVLPLTFSRPCNAGNEHFAGQLGIDAQTVSNNLNSLHTKGYVRIYIDRKAGNRRLIYAYIFGNDLYKYVGEPIQKDSTPLYNDFIELYNNIIEPIQKDYIPSIKSLYTLYKNFVFVYKDERKDERTIERKDESTNVDVVENFSSFFQESPKGVTAESKSPPIAPPPPYNWNNLKDVLMNDAPFLEWAQRELKIDVKKLDDLILDYIVFQHGKGQRLNTDYSDLKSHIVNYGRKKLESDATNKPTGNYAADSRHKKQLSPQGIESVNGRKFGKWEDVL